MKKLIALFAAAVLCLSFAACGGEKAPKVTVDAAALSADLQEKVTYPDECYPLDASMLDALLSPDSMPEGTEATVYLNASSYLRSGVFTCASTEDAVTLFNTLKGFNDRQIKADYDPEEAARLQNVILEQMGPYVVMCVTDDTANAQSVIDSYLK